MEQSIERTNKDYKEHAASIADRIRYLISLSKLSQGKFAQRIGMDPANLSKVLSGVLKMSDVFLNRVVVELGISKNWLITGEGVPFEKAQSQDEIEQIFTNRINYAPKGNGTPVYDIDVTAGYSELSRMFTRENIIGYMDFPKLDNNCVMVKVSGDSMGNVVPDGSLIAIHKVQPDGIICWGQIYVVVLEEYRLVKYIRKHSNPKKVILHSANPNYDDMEIDRKDIVGLFAVDAVVNYKVV